MDIGKQELKLHENIAAVRLQKFAVGDAVTGVAEVIPAGEIVRLDSAIVGHMRQIEWNGSRYGVFSDDLFERTNKLNRAESRSKVKII